MSDTAGPTSYELWKKVRVRYLAILDVVGEVQADMKRGVIPPSRWPHADAVAGRMGVSPSTVRRIVRDWDRFVDVALVEFREDDK